MLAVIYVNYVLCMWADPSHILQNIASSQNSSTQSMAFLYGRFVELIYRMNKEMNSWPVLIRPASLILSYLAVRVL